MAFNSREYEFGDVSITVGGRDVTGIRGVSYKEKIEREAIYGKGRYPHSIQSGNVSIEGEITLLQSEVESLVREGRGSLLSLAVDIVVSYGNPANGDAMQVDRIEGARFLEDSREMKSGDKFMEIKIPFIALNIRKGI